MQSRDAPAFHILDNMHVQKICDTLQAISPSLSWHEQKQTMRTARLAGNLADSNRGCTICFPVNIANAHWYGVVASSDTNFLSVWESVGLDDGARELRIDFLLSVVDPFSC